MARGQARQKIRYLYLLDPVFDVALWGIRNGKVKSDLIELEATGANIAALIQATATKQYDVVMTAVTGVAAAAARGLSLRIISTALYASGHGEGGGIWVRKDSEIKSGDDLKQKTIGSYGLRSTGYLFQRDALAVRYGLNVSLENGDLKQVEIQAPNLPAALATGKVDAASLIHSQAYRAMRSGDFVSVVETGKILNETYGRLVAAVNVAYPERLEERPEAFVEFLRIMRASVTYALENRREVFAAVARDANIDPAFFDWWFDRTSEIPGTFTAAHERAVRIAWNIAQVHGVIGGAPKVESLVWDRVLRA
ncbi:ABC transporter substrate-binding protein [Tardiphaga sp. 215_C5_N2_1]|uniref:ABC transporter substrate-binding protein n=1 Tax=Tardiphaga sp. 215_C5_N2_1 TaxID=3240774 RepID=UPI003F8C77B0